MNDLDDLLARGLAAWPGLTMSRDALASYVTTAGVTDVQHAADLVLACACANGDALALSHLEAHYFSRAGLFLSRIDHDPSFVDEVVQRARERLLVAGQESVPRIARYAGRGPLGAWLRVALVRIALDLKQSSGVQEPVVEEPCLGDDPELKVLRERCRPVFGAAVREAMKELDARTRMILRLHYVDRASIDAIGVSYRVSRATAARWVVAGREELAARVYARLGAQLESSPSELESLIRVVRSDVELSLSTLFS